MISSIVACIALHDVNTTDVNTAAVITEHYGIAQDSILKKLSGRGCKFLAEPNDNKTYVTAAQSYAPIQTMTAQAGTEKLDPFKVQSDINNKLLHRAFDEPEVVKTNIEAQLAKAKAEREAIHIGVHATDTNWAKLLLWINDKYGQDGDDSVWATSQEEYYEYNYYRIHSTIHKTITGNTLKITVTMPSGLHFYYPSVTLNLKGLQTAKITSVSASDSVTGLSYGDYSEGMMGNVDCRKHLSAHATHFVEQYEADKGNSSNKKDAVYFVNQLKPSPTKDALLLRVQ